MLMVIIFQKDVSKVNATMSATRGNTKSTWSLTQNVSRKIKDGSVLG